MKHASVTVEMTTFVLQTDRKNTPTILLKISPGGRQLCSRKRALRTNGSVAMKSNTHVTHDHKVRSVMDGVHTSHEPVGQNQFEWNNFNLFDDDANNSYLEDPTLLSTFTPDWCDTMFQHPPDIALTSHEASSDEEDVVAEGRVPLSELRPRGRPRKKTPTNQLTDREEWNECERKYIVSDSAHSAETTEAASTALSSRVGDAASSPAICQRSTRGSTRSAADSGTGEWRPPISNAARGSLTGRRKATEEARSVLMDWINENKDHPYPTRAQKAELATRTGLTVAQIVHWMSNVRKRRLIPLLRSKREPRTKIDRKFLEEMERRSL